jgi:hypothetical protein
MPDGTIGDLFNSLVGRELPGGCDDCDSFQTMEEDSTYGGVWHLVIHHDDECPSWRAMKAGEN